MDRGKPIGHIVSPPAALGKREIRKRCQGFAGSLSRLCANSTN